MSDAVLVALIMSIPGTIGVIVSAYTAYNMRRVERNTNSLATRLAESNFAQGTAEGKAIGLQQGREEKQ